MSARKIASLGLIDRRQFMQLSAGSLALAAAACRRGGDPAYRRGSTVIMAVSSVNDIKPDESDLDFLVFSPLTELDEHGALRPRLAQSWELSPDRLEWTYHLRRDVRWHDGVPVTAHDVKFTLDLVSHPDVDQYSFGAVTVVDDYTVTVRVHRFQDDWGDNINADIVFYPKHLLEGLDPKKFMDWEFWTHPVGSGPYRFVRYVPETMMELEANPEYFRGKPKIERVVLKFVGAAGVTELLSGQVDIVHHGLASQIPRVLADPRFRVHYDVLFIAWVIFWKHDNPLFRDPRVRRALTLAIDRTECLRILNLPADLPGSDGVFMPRVLFGGKLPAPLPYDPAEANALLDAAGWHDRDGEGVRQRNGRAFHFTATVPSVNDLPDLAVLVQAHLRRVGVQMEIQAVMDTSGVGVRIRSGRWEAAFGYLRPWRDVQKTTFGQGNVTGYSNLEAFRLIDAAGAASDPDELDRVYGELTEVYRNDLPFTHLVTRAEVHFAHRRVNGLRGWRSRVLSSARFPRFRARPDRYMEDLWLDNRSD